MATAKKATAKPKVEKAVKTIEKPIVVEATEKIVEKAIDDAKVNITIATEATTVPIVEDNLDAIVEQIEELDARKEAFAEKIENEPAKAEELIKDEIKKAEALKEEIAKSIDKINKSYTTSWNGIQFNF